MANSLPIGFFSLGLIPPPVMRVSSAQALFADQPKVPCLSPRVRAMNSQSTKPCKRFGADWPVSYGAGRHTYSAFMCAIARSDSNFVESSSVGQTISPSRSPTA